MTESDPNNSAAAEQGVLSTTLNRRWLIKMGVFLTAMIILGAWGLVDATVVYPGRGREDAEFKLLNYLKSADKAGLLMNASVADPADALEKLEQGVSSEIEKTKGEWLAALSLVENLEAITKANQAAGPKADTQTMFADPELKKQTLDSKWNGKPTPVTLSKYDIPVQWLFTLVGFGVALYMILFLFKCSRTKYTYDTATNRLTMPSGKTFTPAEITEVDRRRWHKFFVDLKLADGSAVALDLLRFSPLEDWFLEMEKLTPGYVPPPPEEEPAPAAEDGATEVPPASEA